MIKYEQAESIVNKLPSIIDDNNHAVYLNTNCIYHLSKLNSTVTRFDVPENDQVIRINLKTCDVVLAKNKLCFVIIHGRVILGVNHNSIKLRLFACKLIELSNMPFLERLVVYKNIMFGKFIIPSKELL